MSDSIKDTRDLAKQGDINTMKAIFQEPSRLSWVESEEKQLDELYQIAQLEDPEDPMGWISEFNQSHPAQIEVGTEKRRLGKILLLAQMNLDAKQNPKQHNKRVKREF